MKSVGYIAGEVDRPLDLGKLLQAFRLSANEIDEELSRLAGFLSDIEKPYDSNEGRHLIRYALATTSRVGGHFLGQILWGLGGAQPHEFLSSYHLNEVRARNGASLSKNSLQHYWEEIFASQGSSLGATSTFGIKLAFNILFSFLQHGNFPFGFRSWKWIYLYRKDVVAQGISLYVAQKVDSWNSFNGQDRIERLRIEDCDVDDALNSIQIVINERMRWELFFSLFQISPLYVAYEDVVQNALNQANVVREFLGLGNNALSFREVTLLSKQEAPIYHQIRAAISDKLLS